VTLTAYQAFTALAQITALGQRTELQVCLQQSVLAYEILQFQTGCISPHYSLNYYYLGKNTSAYSVSVPFMLSPLHAGGSTDVLHVQIQTPRHTCFAEQCLRNLALKTEGETLQQ